ncbi:hypothetical protein Cs7R123_36180 [Catellatospora sp. TT07R-123]|uniref:hypothetical protein n=1 Tax=Catellatospora sp. TT07R-123 TaxID=2733863 RepID=UPI001B17C00C|nr:hypothetical protein [Catellatospora sp. TT07R-123]GHJ46276.1 hypothetical protein Cs7R123_36180 [Catellatospora sp. TT07R-123]
MTDETRQRPVPVESGPVDEERLAALDDLPETVDASTEAFAAAVDDIVALHEDLLARLAQ